MVNWEIVSSTGEWAGAIAVVATLVYLARQIHQDIHGCLAMPGGRKYWESIGRHNGHDAFAEWVELLLESDDPPSVIV